MIYAIEFKTIYIALTCGYTIGRRGIEKKRGEIYINEE